MDGLPWIIISLVIAGVAIGLILVLFIVRKGKPAEMTGSAYLTFFIIGISYLSVGISLSFIYSQDTDFFNFFTFMGIIFTAMGLANIDKWKKKPP